MDSDRKSTVSSFYGRKGSLDALNSDYPTSGQNYGRQSGTHGRDDASSFFQPDAVPRNVESERFGSAGYNRNSFFHAGREEPLKGGRDEEEASSPAWDVYADFNNAGPRYSNAFGQSLPQGNKGYQPLEGNMPKVEPFLPEPNSNVELVTVPALGPEWQRSELQDMTKSGRKEKKAEQRSKTWKAWNRDQRGLFGKKWLTRKAIVLFLFGLCAVIVLVLVFTIPRVPGVAFNGNNPLLPATGAFNSSIPTLFSVAPANFSFPALAALQLDTTASFVPITFTHMYATVIDSDTNALVATGDLGHKTVPAHDFVNIQLPLNFTYSAVNNSDQTWATWHNACLNPILYANGSRPGLNFRFVVEMHIVGVIGAQSTSAQVNNANCPIQLPTTSA